MIQHTPQVKWRRTQTGSFWEVGRWETQHRSLRINADTHIRAQTHAQTRLPDSYPEFIHLNLVFTSPSLPGPSSIRVSLFTPSAYHSNHATVHFCPPATLPSIQPSSLNAYSVKGRRGAGDDPSWQWVTDICLGYTRDRLLLSDTQTFTFTAVQRIIY